MKRLSRSPAASSAKRPTAIILARAGRQLAAAARAAGMCPLVADLFGDSDTRMLAARWRPVVGNAAFNFQPASLRHALQGLQRLAPEAPVVWGSGFEGRVPLLEELRAQAEVLGSPGAALGCVWQPWRLAQVLRTAGIATPAIQRERVPRSGEWLVKRLGGAGGGHVRPGKPGASLGARDYAQARVNGRSLSVSWVAAANEVRVLGFCEHLFWSDTPDSFRYGGAVVRRDLPRALQTRVAAALRRLGRALDLRGLMGIDFVLERGGGWQVVELNPRPTATFDLLARAGDVWRAHLAACRDQPIGQIRALVPVAAHAVLYAPQPFRMPRKLDWPSWVSDRPQPGVWMPAGAPICTVRAAGHDAARARHALAGRLQRLCGWLGITLGAELRTRAELTDPR